MFNDVEINIFDKGEILKYAPFWNMIEKYIDRISHKKNIRELLTYALEDESKSMIKVLSSIIKSDDAYELVNGIKHDVINLAVEKPEIDCEDLFNELNKSLDELLLYSCSPTVIKKEEIVKNLMTQFIYTVMSIKEGADVFCDFAFSNSIITEKLEKTYNIQSLFYFLSQIMKEFNLSELRKELGYGK